MHILRFFHDENTLFVDGQKYKATCPVRNELNKERVNEVLPQTFPAYREDHRAFYQPRKFPTGIYEITVLDWTDDPTYAPVKIKTTATRKVFIYDDKFNIIGVQEDSCYFIHFGEDSLTTLGCIRLDSPEDAREIAKKLLPFLMKKEKIYIEVIASRKCERV